MILPTSRSSAERVTRPGITKVKQMAYANAELRKWNQRPFESALSKDAANARFSVKGGKLATRTSVMCRWCGSVFIASADRLRKSGKSGELYCDRECAGKHRSYLYKGNDEIHDVIRKARGLQPKYAKSNVHCKRCQCCGVAFFAQRAYQRYCSTQCTKAITANQSRLEYWKQLKDKARQASRPRRCNCCGALFTAIKFAEASVRCCSQKCQKIATRKAAKHVRRERMRVPVSIKRGNTSIKHLMQKHKARCVSCGCTCEMTSSYHPNQATADHIVPLSKGGLHVEDNLQLMCHQCNSNKSDAVPTNMNLILF